MNILGLIPARGGSKRVEGKNIRLLNGKPLIAHSIEQAFSSSLINRVFVSTDDDKIRDIAVECGVDVPFLRPSEISQDRSPDKPYIVHAVESLRELGYQADHVVLLRPTAPLRPSHLIDTVVRKLVDSDADSIRTMTEVAGVHHPYWMYRLDHRQIAEPFISSTSAEHYYQSQLLPSIYRLNGVVDVIKIETLYGHDYLYGNKIMGYPIEDEYSFDIDTEFDFLLCEAFIKNKLKKPNIEN